MRLRGNQKGIVLSGLIYALLIFYLLLLVSLLTILWYRQSALNNLREQAKNVYENSMLLDYNTVKGVNHPKLAKGMTPIKWDEDEQEWVDTTENDNDWYDYNISNKKWANARTDDCTVPGFIETCSMWVWIPRYVYKISSGWHGEGLSVGEAGVIDIQFSVGIDDTLSGSITLDDGTGADASKNKWTNHPAFTFGDIELTGIWVAKFEATAAEGVLNNIDGDNVTSKTVKVIPNVQSWRHISIGNSFTVIRNMETNNVYGWGTSGSGIDTHMMKNTEWGAVAYLSKSIYGKGENEIWVNPANNYTTGCSGNSVTSVPTDGCLRTYDTTNGVESSTTGTIYGIYDMNGSAWESVMGNLGNTSNQSQISDVSLIPDKYINRYSADTNAYTINSKGDAIYETSNDPGIWDGSNWTGNQVGSWYTDSSRALAVTAEWYGRGGDYYAGNSGIFAFGPYNGGPQIWLAFRPVLVISDGI